MTYVIKDSDGNILNTIDGDAEDSWIGQDYHGTTVASVEQLPAPDLTEHNRRLERESVFKVTIDRLTGPWFESLSDDDKAKIKAFREVWLDYPSTGVIPDNKVYNEGQDDEYTVSTDVYHIF